jgi:hypothetical protein
MPMLVVNNNSDGNIAPVMVVAWVVFEKRELTLSNAEETWKLEISRYQETRNA